MFLRLMNYINSKNIKNSIFISSIQKLAFFEYDLFFVIHLQTNFMYIISFFTWTFGCLEKIGIYAF